MSNSLYKVTTGPQVTYLSRRELFAAMAMQGLLAEFRRDDELTCGTVADIAVNQADALIAELDKEEENTSCPQCGGSGLFRRYGHSDPTCEKCQGTGKRGGRMSDHTHAYIGIKPCGCVVAVTVDDGGKYVAKDVAEFIESGLIIQRVLIANVALKRCKCGQIEMAKEGA